AEARAVYAEAAGIARVLPQAVAVPVDADDVVALVRWAAATGTALIPRGSGSSMGGGAVGDGVVVDLSRLDEIGPVDVTRRRLWVGPGALRDQVEATARARKLRFPPDPASGAFCTVGGMAATNAAGARTLKFGATRPWIAALDCVFADGTRATVRRGAPPPEGVPALERLEAMRQRVGRRALLAAGSPTGVRKDSSGYALTEYVRGDLVDLLVGSEGTLALFVGLELALKPVPGATSSVLAAFDTLEACVEAAGVARELGACACEMLDRTFLDVARRGDAPVPVPEGAEGVLLVELEGADAATAADQARRVERAFRDRQAASIIVALHPTMEKRLWELRHLASPTLARLYPDRASMQFIEDGAVPPERLPEYVRGVRAALARQETPGAIFGHAGDAHVHVNPLVDMHAPDWRARVNAILREVTELVARLGGTLAGEHGDGRLRTPLLRMVRSAEVRALYAEVKAAFDPAGILNPGVKVPLPGQRPLAAVKYDPTLAPLPPAARAALERVARERAYAAFRLDLLDESG
ncbi:MAG TPA: FAD-linked oxidase C-terminal domain-containing protein, partial [Gemmatimonadaceae bacterium]|nr:FAD-linked oxidase C-terminal domain-containing protein [Gemmatimonadaceae bacterium]